MENIPQDFFTILQYLLPGFLAAWVFYGFTSFPKPTQFERVIQALVFTLVIQLFVFFEKTIFFEIGRIKSFAVWTTRAELIFSTITALIVGCLFAYFANNDMLHNFARKLGITRETSYPSEWFGTFLNNMTYVVLHLKDERRLYGWPIEWPSDPNKGHFVLELAIWLPDDESGVEIPLKGVKSIMIDVKDVKWVEFIERTWEEKNE